MPGGANNVTDREGDKTVVDVSMLEPGDTIILIVGMTGVGKSTFINEAVGSPATTINHNLNASGNQTVQPVICSHPDDSTRRLVILDTPGFDHTWHSDMQVLMTIAAWLQSASCEKEATLGGIVYLYDISQARHQPINGSLAMFYRPEGSKEAKNVVLATTKWTQPMNDDHERNEELLRTDDKLTRFRHCRFMNTRDSAWEIVELLLKEEQLDNSQFRRASDALVQSIAMQKREEPDGGGWRNLFLNKTSFNQMKRKDSDNLVPVPGARDTDVIIPIMGSTGAGKSNFINVAAGKEVTPVGYGLKSCTSTILPIVVPFPNNPDRRIIFVDTPGFGDTYPDDTEILRRIAAWMAFAYDEKMKLTGIIYLHDISQKRILGTMRNNFLMFDRLTGIKAAKSVVFATTMWNEVGEDEGKNREYQLSTTRWHNMLEQGSHLCRFGNTHESAWDIVNRILDRSKSTTR